MKDCEYDGEKVTSKIKYLIATLDTNAVHLNSPISEILNSIHNDNLCKDHRSHAKMCKIDYDKGRLINVISMLTDVEKTYSNLTRKKKCVSPADSSSSSKCVSLLATRQKQPDQFIAASQKILLSSEGESLRQALLAQGTFNQKKHDPELVSLAAPAPGNSHKKQVDNKTAYCCDFHKYCCYVSQHTSDACRAKKKHLKK